MTHEQSTILAALDKRRDKLERWMAAHPSTPTRLPDAVTLDEWYATHRRPSEAEQVRLHGRVVGPERSGIEQCGVLADELHVRDTVDLLLFAMTLVAEGPPLADLLGVQPRRRSVTLTIPICA